jgi:hypothetical protein
MQPDQLTPVLRVLDAAGIPHARIGVAGGARLSVKGLLDLDLTEATDAWRDRLPAALGHGTTQG